MSLDGPVSGYSDSIAAILSKGRSLFKFDYPNWALTLTQAKEAVAALQSLGAPILGVEVITVSDSDYRYVKGGVEGVFADPLPQERIDQFVERSAEVAMSFLDGSTYDASVLFVLVPGDENQLPRRSHE